MQLEFAFSGTINGKAVSGKATAANVSANDPANAIYAAVTGKPGATLSRRRNDWSLSSLKAGGYEMRTYGRDGSLEIAIQFRAIGRAAPDAVTAVTFDAPATDTPAAPAKLARTARPRSANHNAALLAARFYPAGSIMLAPGRIRQAMGKAAILAGSVFDLARAADMRRAGAYDRARRAIEFARAARLSFA